jgi:hypothetical protein
MQRYQEQRGNGSFVFRIEEGTEDRGQKTGVCGNLAGYLMSDVDSKCS